MASYTEHYQLHQWEPGDAFLRTDFNEDLEKIDTALGALSVERIAHGSYVGDGTNDRTIQLPFAPEFVIVFGHYQNTSALTILTQETHIYAMGSETGTSEKYNLILKENVLQVQNAGWNNLSGKTTRYIAIR